MLIPLVLAMSVLGSAGPPGFVEQWLGSVISGREVPVSLQLCKLVPAGTRPPVKPGERCNIKGAWRYSGNSVVCKKPLLAPSPLLPPPDPHNKCSCPR